MYRHMIIGEGGKRGSQGKAEQLRPSLIFTISASFSYDTKLEIHYRASTIFDKVHQLLRTGIFEMTKR